MMTKTKIPSFEECITIAKYFYESMHDYIFYMILKRMNTKYLIKLIKNSDFLQIILKM